MSTSNCVQWDGSSLGLPTLEWVEFVEINKDWWYTKNHMTDGTIIEEGPFESFSFPTPIDKNMDSVKNPDGWINKEVIFSFYDANGIPYKTIVRLHYPDGSTLDGIEGYEGTTKPEDAVEMPKQADIHTLFEEKVRRIQNEKSEIS